MKYAIKVVWPDGTEEFVKEGSRHDGRVAVFGIREARRHRDFMALGFDEDEIQSINIVEAPAGSGALAVAHRKLQSLLLTWDDGSSWVVDGPEADVWWLELPRSSAKYLVLYGHPGEAQQVAQESLAATPEEAFEGRRGQTV